VKPNGTYDDHKDITVLGPHDKPLPPSVGHGGEVSVAQDHIRGPRMGSLKIPCRTSYWSSIVSIVLNYLVSGDRQTNK